MSINEVEDTLIAQGECLRHILYRTGLSMLPNWGTGFLIPIACHLHTPYCSNIQWWLWAFILFND